MNQHPPVMTIGEASRALGVSPETLRRWADRGLIRVMTLPSGHRRFYIKDVQSILDARTRGGAA